MKLSVALELMSALILALLLLVWTETRTHIDQKQIMYTALQCNALTQAVAFPQDANLTWILEWRDTDEYGWNGDMGNLAMSHSH
jgi:hypothetical protein